MPPRNQDFRRQPHGLAEIFGNGSKSCKKKIAEAMAFQSRPFYESMLEQLGEQSLIFGKRNDAVADVTWRQHVQFFAQASAGATVIADGNHGAKIRNFGFPRFRGGSIHGWTDIPLQSLE